jgi:hypothetical protein
LLSLSELVSSSFFVVEVEESGGAAAAEEGSLLSSGLVSSSFFVVEVEETGGAAASEGSLLSELVYEVVNTGDRTSIESFDRFMCAHIFLT